MAGEAVSRTSLTVAFQRKQNLEWRKLRQQLHLQLQQDIGRIYTNSLYCDLELVFNSTSIKTHRSILQVRATRFFTKLCTVHPTLNCSGLHSVLLGEASIDCVENFVRSLYTKCAVIYEEDAVRCLKELHDTTKNKSDVIDFNDTIDFSSGDSGLSPESDVYLTPKSSPSEIHQHFDETLKLSSDNIESESTETILNLQKTNRSYYTIVPVDEAFIEENNSNKTVEAVNVLEKELAEQDELLKSFHSIKSKEDKKTNKNKISKPTSLPFTSSQYTKNNKHGCDITYVRDKKEGKALVVSKIQLPLCNKEEFSSLPSTQSVHKDRNSDKLSRINAIKKEKYIVDKFEGKENTIQEEEEKGPSKDPSPCRFGVVKSTNYCVETKNNINNDILEEEEEFMESPGEGMDCELECCKKKDLVVEDLLNFPCSPEMDASGGGPDSGLDTSSTGCMPGGGFSSPREHTVSETSGVDLTEAAIGEDMPHDGDVEVLYQKPVKSSTSSSVSSDAGTWDSTFPSTQFNETHEAEYDGMIEAQVPFDDNGASVKPLIEYHELESTVSTRELCHEEEDEYSLNTKTRNVHINCQNDALILYSDNSQVQRVTQMETDRQLECQLQEMDQHLDTKLIDERSSATSVSDSMHTLLSDVDTPLECTLEQNVNEESSFDQCIVHSEHNIREPSQKDSINKIESILQDTSVKPNDSKSVLVESSSYSESPPTWKINNQNNYFINAADLADDSEMLLPPEPTTSEEQDTVATETDKSELGVMQESSYISPCEENKLSTCDIVNKGITDCLNMKAKYSTLDKLPIEVHSETFSEDVVPFLSSHLKITDESIIANNLECLTESSFRSLNVESVPECPLMKLTTFKGGSGKLDSRMSSGQDIFAEFQKEIKMTEHLEPHINIRKVHGGWKRSDSSSSEGVSKKESQLSSLNVLSDSDKLENKCDNVSDESTVCKERDQISCLQEVSTAISVNEIPDEPKPSELLDNKQVEQENTVTKSDSDHVSDEKELNTETEVRRPSLIRRNTFELDPDDDRLALLRQEYERRQGNLLFQSCIPQFSGHLTGSEGFRDTQSLLLVTSKNEDVSVDELQQRSLPTITPPDSSLTETISYLSNINSDQVISRPLITESSPLVLPSRILTSHEIHTPDSLNNDGPLDSLFHLNQISLSQQRSKNRQFCESIDRGYKYPEENKIGCIVGTDNVDNGNNKSTGLSNPKVFDSAKEVERANLDDLKRMSNSFDNSTKPVISGALTCNDVVVDEKRSCDSPKKQKRTESTPIVSGGVSSMDFVVPARPVSDSPIMARRKNELAPILSGGAPVLVDLEPEESEEKSTSNVMTSSVRSAWVVDMSDCNASKLPQESRRQKKNDTANGSEQIVEIKDTLQSRQSEGKSTSLGFFVDLKDSSTGSQSSKKPMLKDRKETSDKDSTSHESSPRRRNSGVGFFVDLKEHKDSTESRLLSSEGRETSSDIETDEVKSLTKSAPCGFFVNLNKKSINEQAVEKNNLLHADDKNSVSDKKNTLFSMFIDIGEPGIKENSSSKEGASVEPTHIQVCSPHLSSHKKLGFRNHVETTVSGNDSNPKITEHTQDGSKSPKGTFMYIDATVPQSVKAIPVPCKSTCRDEIEHRENKKQGFFMFIETESPVTRRKTLPSGLRPNLNRHSWNLEPRVSEHGDDKQKNSDRRHHKRAHSVSVERGSVCSPSDESKSSSSTSLAKCKMRGSSQSLHEATASPEQSILTQFGEGTLSKQMSSCHCRLPSKSYDRLTKRNLSYEGKSESGKETPDIDTISEGKPSGEGDSQVADALTGLNGASKNLNSELKIVETSDKSDIRVDEISQSTNKDADIIQEKEETVCNISSKVQDNHQNEIENTNEEHSSILKGVTSIQSEILKSNKEIEAKSLESSFVKLSDLDKDPPKTMSNVSDNSDVLPSFATANRMTRSIPETSWIESKLLMTRSIGGGTSSRSLSRLFPHLHTTMTATSSPSNIGRSKSPNAIQPDADDNDTQISETSDLSSMQSSMGPSGLEGSTEETDASSSYAGRSGPVSRLGEDLLRMFLEEINPDVTVEVGGRRLKAHKCILSSRCQYFAAMLSGGWVESAGNVISLQGFSYNAVHFALCHIYSGTSNIPDTISIVELATLADMLGLEGLKEVIMYTLKVKYCHFFHKPCTMCAAGVLECLPLAAAYGLDDIYRKSLRWITKYFVRIWPTKGFASLPRELIEKCYQQHVVHMSVDNILETVMCCDKLLATLPNVRWAEPVFGITSQLLEASIKFIANNFCGVLSSDSFLSLGKELSWNISRLEDSLMAATDRLPPDQACQSHARLHNILTIVQSPEPPPEMQWSPSFVELLRRIQKRVEASLVRQAPRAARCPSWSQMELELRKKIQEAACLVLVPGEEGHRSRHASLARRGESVGSNSVYCTAPRSVSSSGSRNLDLRQVKLAMTQQARRAASGGRVSTLRADTKSRSQSAKKLNTHVPAHKAETVSSQAKKVVSENEEATARPKTWPLRVLENKSKSVKQRANSSSSSMGTPEKSGAVPRRAGKTMISSSDSSRTSSPAMRRSTSSGEGSGRGRAGTVGNGSTRNLLRRSETPPGKEIKYKKRKDGEITTMSTDSLSEVQSNGGGKRTIKEVGESVTSRSCISTRPDTPSVKRKLREEVVMSTDSLAESVASGEKLTGKVETSASAPSRSLGSTRPDTPPVKERGRKCLGRIGTDVTMSTDSLAATEQTFVGEVSTLRKMEVAKIVTIPKSPTSKGSQAVSNRLDGSKGNLSKGIKPGETKNETGQPRSPAAATRRVVMRQTIVSPRDSPTFRLRSGVTSSSYAGSPSLRRSLLLATRSPTSDNATSVNSNLKLGTPTKITASAKSEKVIVKSLSSPSSSITVNKRTSTRVQTRNQPVASPVKSSSESGRMVGRTSGREVVRISGTSKGITNVSKANNNANRKAVSNGCINGKNKQNNNEVSTPNKKGESSEDKPPTVGSRSGTFLKDEPTILKKPDVDNVHE